MSEFGTMRRSSASALPVLLLAAALVLGVDGMEILPQTTAAGAVTKFLRAAIASYKDPLQLSAAVGRCPCNPSHLISTYSCSPHLDRFLPYDPTIDCTQTKRCLISA